MTAAPPGPGAYEQMLRRLLSRALESDAVTESPPAVAMCAPRWVLERISDETDLSIETNKGVPTITTDSLVVTAVPALEQEGGLGFVAAVDVISGRCVEITACHGDVAPDRWPDLALALAYGLGPAAALAIEMMGTSRRD